MNERKLSAKLRGSDICIDAPELLESPEIADLLARRHVYNERLIEALVKIVVRYDGQNSVDWEGIDDEPPWTIWSTGTQQPFDRARDALLPLVDEATQNYVTQLKTREESHHARAQEYYGKYRDMENLVFDAYRLGRHEALDTSISPSCRIQEIVARVGEWKATQ